MRVQDFCKGVMQAKNYLGHKVGGRKGTSTGSALYLLLGPNSFGQDSSVYRHSLANIQVMVLSLGNPTIADNGK